MPLWKWRLLFEAAFWLPVWRIALLALPFPRIGRHLGTLQSAPGPERPEGSVDPMEAREVGWAVNCIADRFPLEMVCLPRALAAWQMLHRRGLSSRLHFGAPIHPQEGGPAVQTHAWLSCGEARVTGYPVADQCVELGYFSRAAAAKLTKRHLQNSPEQPER